MFPLHTEHGIFVMFQRQHFFTTILCKFLRRIDESQEYCISSDNCIVIINTVSKRDTSNMMCTGRIQDKEVL